MSLQKHTIKAEEVIKMSVRYAIADLESNALWSRQQKDFLVIQGTDFLTSIQGASLWPEETDAEYELKKMLLNSQSMQHVNVPNLRVVQVDLDQHRITTIPVATQALPQMPNGTLQKPLLNPSQVTELRDVKEVAAILEHGDFLKQLNDFCKIATYAEELKTALQYGISLSDKAIEDMLHVIELGTFNACQGYEISKTLKGLRQKRRRMKDELTALNLLIPDEQINRDKMSAAICANWLKNMDGRTYTFRNADVKQKFGNLVTQTQEEGK